MIETTGLDYSTLPRWQNSPDSACVADSPKFTERLKAVLFTVSLRKAHRTGLEGDPFFEVFNLRFALNSSAVAKMVKMSDCLLLDEVYKIGDELYSPR